MDQSHQAFRTFEPLEGNPVNAAAWTCTGDKLVVSTVGSKLRVFDRDAAPLLTTVRGDPYLADVSRTKGHASAIGEVTTHPTDKDVRGRAPCPAPAPPTARRLTRSRARVVGPGGAQVFLSCGQDSTMRLWNVNGRRNLGDLVNSAVIRARSARNTRVPVTCCAFSVTANAVVCGCEDGSLQLWQTRAKFTRPDRNIRAAHNGAVTRLRCGRDGHSLATRGMDDTVRLWDLRRLKAPVRTLGGVPTLLATAGVDFSPDGNTLVAGTNVKPHGEDRAELLFWNLMESGASATRPCDALLWPGTAQLTPVLPAAPPPPSRRPGRTGVPRAAGRRSARHSRAVAPPYQPALCRRRVWHHAGTVQPQLVHEGRAAELQAARQAGVRSGLRAQLGRDPPPQRAAHVQGPARVRLVPPQRAPFPRPVDSAARDPRTRGPQPAQAAAQGGGEGD